MAVLVIEPSLTSIPNSSPIIVFEDEHLLVVNKPPGWNTHSPSEFAGEGVYEWLKFRERRWAQLAIIHRLDKETSGVMVFSKTPEANRSLTQQFTEGKVRKEYVLQTMGRPPKGELIVQSRLARAGERYRSVRGGGVEAVTEFEVLKRDGPITTILARPRTGRTHQIRVHAAENGFPILGDALYGGAARRRLFLHAHSISFAHPAGGRLMEFEQLACFEQDTSELLRQMIDCNETNAFRLVHGAADGFPNWYLDQFGANFLSQGPSELTGAALDYVKRRCHGRTVYHKITTARVRETTTEEASPKLILGEPATNPFVILENGARFEISFDEGYSVGLFLDQRDNRRRLLNKYAGPGFELEGKEALNTFAYTCGFSVCAAMAGMRATSLDLSRKYLDWGRRNFELNSLNPADHDFIYGDVFDWMKRLGKKGRQFDLILLDPPTFSKSKESGVFRAETDYPRLVADALRLLRKGGVLFASSNAARWAPEPFLAAIHNAIDLAGRRIVQEKYFPQPPDFPISREEPGYLKTVWLRVE